MRLLCYGNRCNDFTKLAVDLAVSEKTKEIVDMHMIAMGKKLAALKKANADALKKKKRENYHKHYRFFRLAPNFDNG